MIVHALRAFLDAHAPAFVLGCFGAADGIDDDCSDWFDSFFTELRNQHVVLATGGTKFGIPHIATMRALAHDVPVVGILPQRGDHHRSSAFAFHDASQVGSCSDDAMRCCVVIPPILGSSRWGDESPLLTRICDVALLFGGAWGTSIEIAHLMKENQDALKKQRPVTPLVIPSLASGYEGASEYFRAAPWMTPDLRSAVFLGEDDDSASTTARRVVASLTRS
jgi:hypothetical protein